MKFVSVRSSYGNLSLFELVQGLQYDFPENFRCNLPLNERENFSDFLSMTLLNPKVLDFLFLRKIAFPGERNVKN